MKTKLLITILILIVKFSFGQQFTDLYGDYLGQVLPGDTPTVFAMGIISIDSLIEHSAPAFSPDGNEVYWVADQPPGPHNSKWRNLALNMRRVNGRWSVPSVTPYDITAISPDGSRGYFWDNKEKDIFTIEKQGDKWGEPKSLNFISRYPELKIAIDPSITHDGTIYFMGLAEGMGLIHNYAIYRAKFVKGEYSRPELLPQGINLPSSQNWTPYIAPDESYIIFSSHRSGQFGQGDLYISFHNVTEDTWTEPFNMGKPINTAYQERLPGLSPDGKYLFFTRSTPLDDVYWVNTRIIDKLREKSNIKK